MKILKCDVCPETFDRKFSLDRHKQTVHSKAQHRYQCKECKKTFPRRDNLQRHERSHRAEGLVECSICFRGFRSDYIAQHRETCKARTGQRSHGSQHVLKVRPFSARAPCKDKQLHTPYDGTAHIKVISFGSDLSLDMAESAAETPVRLMHLDAVDNDLRSKLRHYIEKDDVDQVKFYATLLGRTNTTLLMYACYTSSLQVARYLISTGVNIDNQDTRGNTALHVACHRGRQDIVELLLNAGADVHVHNAKGYTALALTAARGDQTAMAALLLSAGAKVEGDREEAVLLPLQPDTADSELAKADRLNEGQKILDARQKTPLFNALKYGCTETVLLLLKHGCRPEVLPSECRENLLNAAVDNLLGTVVTRYSFAKEKLQLLSWYTKFAGLPSDMMDDVRRRKLATLTKQIVQLFKDDNVPEITRLMGSGPDGRPFLDDVARTYGQTYGDILVDAVHENRLGVVKLLLDRGYDSNAISADGLTAFYIVTFRGDTDMMELLLRYGAKIDRILHGKTPLCLAASCGRIAAVKVLVERGAKVNGGGGTGDCTPLEHAVSFQGRLTEREQMMEYLIRKGADVNLGSRALLEKALLDGSARMVELLLNAGALTGRVSLSCMSKLRQYAKVSSQANAKLRLMEKKQDTEGAASQMVIEETARRWTDMQMVTSGGL